MCMYARKESERDSMVHFLLLASYTCSGFSMLVLNRNYILYHIARNFREDKYLANFTT